MKYFLTTITFIIFIACTMTPSNPGLKEDLLQKIKSVFLEELPIQPANQTELPLLEQDKVKKFDESIKSLIYEYDSDGNLLLPEGDFTIPVMTYCLQSQSSSPSKHQYTLSTLIGKRADIIKKITSRASPQFSFDKIQLLIWSLQADLKYSELSENNKAIINFLFLETPSELKSSLLDKLEKETWFKNDKILNLLGDAGTQIRELQNIHEQAFAAQDDFNKFSALINTQTTKPSAFKTTPWSQIENNISARFVTEGHYQNIGFLQIHVQNTKSNRTINNFSREKIKINISSLIANPRDKSIQPLAFSPIYGIGGIAATTAIIESPAATALIIAAILATQPINWDKYFDLRYFANNSSEKNIIDQLRKGNLTLQKEHDKLEKPARDAGIISGKTKVTSQKSNGRVREYTKPDGEKSWDSDFEKIKGNQSKTQDGLDYKTTDEGIKVIKRPPGDKQPHHTIEFQSPKQNDSGLKVKVRYEK